jgi:hypothetical protein
LRDTDEFLGFIFGNGVETRGIHAGWKYGDFIFRGLVEVLQICSFIFGAATILSAMEITSRSPSMRISLSISSGVLAI